MRIQVNFWSVRLRFNIPVNIIEVSRGGAEGANTPHKLSFLFSKSCNVSPKTVYTLNFVLEIKIFLRFASPFVKYLKFAHPIFRA